ncbi:hybrid sensor histidine kinase/response regulator [Oxalicibacterium faecigallinarum]|uniref:hybrid sensor histidine kinase/response regulator n=1 Tax=Oxalicibacterium faecigallinarum TaxID=573741 RepID=UPI001666E98B|nr:hybrid sensor histidine kinase/response regulator [Oxalicibacterium faecigallinarum]
MDALLIAAIFPVQADIVVTIESKSSNQRTLQEEIALNRIQREALFEAIDDGFCIIEFIDGPHGPLSDYVHIEANSGYQRHTGISDIIGKRLREIEPDNPDTWLAIYGKVLQTGEPVRFEQEFVAIKRHIEVAATRVGSPEMRQVSVLFRDVTARVRLETALRENVQRVQLALAAGAIIGTWLWDVPADQFNIDEGFANAFGLDPEQPRTGVKLEKIIETVHPEDREGLLAAITKALAQGGPYAHQYRTKRRDGRYYWLEANGRVDLDVNGAPSKFPGVLIDMEGRRAIEAERDHAIASLRALNETLELRVEERTSALLKAEEALRQSQKMEAVGQLSGGLAHDFNNILAGINGSLELLKIRLAQGRLADVDRHLSGAQSAIKRAASLTQRMLAFSRRQTLDPKPANPNHIVAGMTELIGRSVGPSIAIRMSAASDLWNTFVDIGQLENALLNLCINARDAMPDGGTLTIESSNCHLDDARASQLGLSTGAYVSLCVSDTGIGMSKDVVARAFDPFFTTKPVGQGTGLGLSMVYGFAGQSGGTAHIDSEPEQGTRICIYLPRYEGEESLENNVQLAAAVAAAGERKTILIVDDEPLVRTVSAEILKDLGYRLIEAEDGPSALKLMALDLQPDLLITDVGLPNGLNGRQLADAIRAQRPNLPVLFITGYAENAVLNHGDLEAGMQILTKPFATDALTARVESLIGGKSGVA